VVCFCNNTVSSLRVSQKFTSFVTGAGGCVTGGGLVSLPVLLLQLAPLINNERPEMILKKNTCFINFKLSD